MAGTILDEVLGFRPDYIEYQFSPTPQTARAQPPSLSQETGLPLWSPGGSLRQPMLSPALRNARGGTARDVRQPRRCVLTAHRAPASFRSCANLDPQNGLDFGCFLSKAVGVHSRAVRSVTASVWSEMAMLTGFSTTSAGAAGGHSTR